MQIKPEDISEYLSQILNGQLGFSLDTLDQFESDTDKELAYGLVCLAEDLEFHKKNTSIEIESLKKTLFSSSAVAITDNRGRIKTCNTIFETLTGYSSEELIGNTFNLLNSGFHDDAYFKEMWETIGAGNMWKGEFRNKKKNGELFWVTTHIFPIKDASGRIKEYWSIRQDITDKIKAERDLLKKDQELEEAKRLSVIGEFAAGIAHEVNNPLAIINAKTQLLQLQFNRMVENQSYNSEQILNSIETILSTVNHTADLVKNLKMFSIKADFEELEFHHLQGVVEMALNLSHRRCQNAGINVAVNIPSEIKMLSNISALSQIFLNLILNSIAAIQEQEEKWIKIDSEIDGTTLKLYFTDSGNGISEDIRQKIMEPFFTTKDPGSGTGLGLSISLKSMEKMKGKLYYNPESSNTQFVIESEHFNLATQANCNSVLSEMKN